jgi:hypothetical protein
MGVAPARSGLLNLSHSGNRPTYRAAVGTRPNAQITLRNRARVIEQSWTETNTG